MQLILTDTLLKALAPVAGIRLERSDARCSGLTFRVTERGVKSWSFRFRDRRTGRLQRATLGRYPDVSLAQARARADELRGRVAAELNPLEERRREREEAASRTFGAVAERYLNEHARRKKRSAEGDARILRLHILPRWQKRRFDQITRADVIALVERLIADGKDALANRTQALVSTIFTFGIDAGLAVANPCARLRRRGAERARDRVLTDAEIRILWDGGFGPMLLKKSAVERSGRRDVEHAGRCRVSGWHRLRRHRDELGKLSEVLGGGGEVELVSGAVRAA